MLKTRSIKSVAFIVSLLLPLVLFAQQSRVAAPKNQNQIQIEVLGVNNPVSQDDVDARIEYELLNNAEESRAIGLPAVPRLFARRYTPTTVDFEVTGGAEAVFGFKGTFSSRYSLTTYLWLASSTRSNVPGIPDRALNSKNPEDDLFTDDGPVPGLVYPNVKKGFDIVGVCIYEASLLLSDGTKASFLLMGNSASKHNTTGEGFDLAGWSNFFKIDDRNKAIETYLNKDCKAIFNKEVKDYVERNFEKMARQLRALYHPDNRCSHIEERASSGDSSCMAWHHKFGESTRNHTVPRCEMQRDGISRCVLKSKRQSSCPMWYDERGNLTGENPNKSFSLAINSPKSFQCDYGLQCRAENPSGFMQNFKKMIGGVRSGGATCE